MTEQEVRAMEIKVQTDQKSEIAASRLSGVQRNRSDVFRGFSDSLRFINSFKTSGTVTPSSRYLVERMLHPIDFSKAKCIVELGPGNGCVTRCLLERMRADATLVCFEVNQEFIALLEDIDDSRLKILNRCASSIREVLDSLAIDEADYVVSSVPLALLNNDTREKILASIDANLKPGGVYTQYQYSLANYDDIKLKFEHVKLGFTLRNFPPAFVYECYKSI